MHPFNETCTQRVCYMTEDCHSFPSPHCEYSAIYNNFLLPPRQKIIAIHQNLTNVKFHRLSSNWEGRTANIEAQSQRHDSCQNRTAETRQWTLHIGENKLKINKKRGNKLSSPIYEQCTESSLFGLLMTCTDLEGVGGVPPTQHATSHSLDNCITGRDLLL